MPLKYLHEAKVDPRTRCHRLSQTTYNPNSQARTRILRHAIKMEGSSIGDETYRTADNRPGRYSDSQSVWTL